MPYFSRMEKPGWGVVAVIVTGIAVLAFFLVFPNQDGKNVIESDEGGTPTFVDAQAKDKARDTMKVVDGTESTPEIVRGFAEPLAEVQYGRTDTSVTSGDSVQPLPGSPDSSIAGYLNSLASDAPRSLLASIDAGDFATVQNLLDSGEDVHQRDQIGNTALHQAANQGVVEIGAFLIRYGADVNAVNDDGNTPLDVARSEHNIPFEKLLLAYGARPGTPPEARPVSSPE